MRSPSSADIQELRDLEYEMLCVQQALAVQIDNYQAMKYMKHNVPPPEFDVNGLSGRWQTQQHERRCVALVRSNREERI
jgi:hypothetical protein